MSLDGRSEDSMVTGMNSNLSPEIPNCSKFVGCSRCVRVQYDTFGKSKLVVGVETEPEGEEGSGFRTLARSDIASRVLTHFKEYLSASPRYSVASSGSGACCETK